MAILHVERVLDEWATAWSSRDTEKLLALFTKDCIYEDVTFGVVNHGKAELKAFADGIFAAFPDFKVEQTARFVAGDWAGMEWMISGTHKGDLSGMRATNKRFSIRGASILELESGKIKRFSDYWDLATFLKQIGQKDTERAGSVPLKTGPNTRCSFPRRWGMLVLF